jgi:signal transduction histidine kinase
METLIDDLLTVARDGDAVQRREPVDVETAVRACWETVASDEMALDVASTATIDADRSRLKQLLENLLRNAVEHGGDTVSVGMLDDGFFVEDDGEGFRGEPTELFENGVSTKPQGTGVGLAIVKRVADAHGWSLRATAADSGGARVEIYDV